jgi:hypothetical protein
MRSSSWKKKGRSLPPKTNRKNPAQNRHPRRTPSRTSALLAGPTHPLIFSLDNHPHPNVITTLSTKKRNPKAHYCLESLPTMKLPDEGELDSRTVLLI